MAVQLCSRLRILMLHDLWPFTVVTMKKSDVIVEHSNSAFARQVSKSIRCRSFFAACTGVVAGASWCFSILCHSFTAQAWLQSRILMDNLGTGDGILSHHWTKSQDSCTTPTTSYSRRHASFGRFLPFTYGNVVHFLRFERLQTFALLTKEINE
jgi:hypothetical protein